MRCRKASLIAGTLRLFPSEAHDFQVRGRHSIFAQHPGRGSRAPVAQSDVAFGRAAVVAATFDHDHGAGEPVQYLAQEPGIPHKRGKTLRQRLGAVVGEAGIG